MDWRMGEGEILGMRMWVGEILSIRMWVGIRGVMGVEMEEGMGEVVGIRMLDSGKGRDEEEKIVMKR